VRVFAALKQCFHKILYFLQNSVLCFFMPLALPHYDLSASVYVESLKYPNDSVQTGSAMFGFRGPDASAYRWVYEGFLHRIGFFDLQLVEHTVTYSRDTFPALEGSFVQKQTRSICRALKSAGHSLPPRSMVTIAANNFL
jgi:hypothetical protein